MNTYKFISSFLGLLLLPVLSFGYADEAFEYGDDTVVYRFIIDEPSDIKRVSGELVSVTSRNGSGETRVRYFRVDRLQSITKKTDGPSRISDKYIQVLLEPEKEIVGGRAIHAAVEFQIDERLLSLEQVVFLLNP